MDKECWMKFKMLENQKLDVISIVTSIEELKKTVEKLKRRNVYRNQNEVEPNFDPDINESMERILDKKKF